MTVLYDNLAINREILLDLPFREGRGVITQDVAKPHHPVTLIDTPTWTTLDNRIMTLDFNGTSEYLQCLGADSGDLNFTTGPYSVGCWFNYSGGQAYSILARYEITGPGEGVSGWEVFWYNNIVTLRHHHAAGTPTRTAGFSTGWTSNTWLFMGISRIGAASIHYRNGVALTMVHSDGGLVDPETCARDLVNCRYSKDGNFANGGVWRPRVWGRALSPSEWLGIYNHEKRWFEW